MRLIHVHTRKLQEFFDSDIPPYAILSHRWGAVDDEVLHYDYLNGFKEGTSGFRKIDNFCQVAAGLDYEWAWVDTCCIDKSSSAELSEAINSMFAWYQASRICIVQLEDVTNASDLKSFEKSIWFSRGWTLQELLAPTSVTFYTKDWQVIGTKNSLALAPRISRITGIPQRVLKQPEILHRISVARRMSWAAGRQTSRLEDIAYCLLGIFDIHMPLVYGEGSKAFYRLQTQIMDQVEDESLFAWKGRASTRQWELHGLLAKSPANFASCGNIVITQTSSKLQSPPIRMTSRGAEVFAELSETDASTHDGSPIFLYSLGCANANDNSTYLDVQVGTDVLRQNQLKPCSIALTRKAEREPFCRTDAGKSPSELSLMYQRIDYVRPEQFYIRTSFSQIAAFAKVYDTGIGRTKSLLRPTRIVRLPSKPRPVSTFASIEPYGVVPSLASTSAQTTLVDEFPLTRTGTAQSALDDDIPVVPTTIDESTLDNDFPLEHSTTNDFASDSEYPPELELTDPQIPNGSPLAQTRNMRTYSSGSEKQRRPRSASSLLAKAEELQRYVERRGSRGSEAFREKRESIQDLQSAPGPLQTGMQHQNTFDLHSEIEMNGAEEKLPPSPSSSALPPVEDDLPPLPPSSTTSPVKEEPSQLPSPPAETTPELDQRPRTPSTAPSIQDESMANPGEPNFAHEMIARRKSKKRRKSKRKVLGMYSS